MTPKTIAFGTGAVIYLTVLYRFQTYTQRNHMSAGAFLLFAALLCLAAVFLAATLKGAKKLATFLMLGVMAAHMLIIIVDTREDPTNHNLAPFEFVMFALLCSPAFLGAWFGRWLSR